MELSFVELWHATGPLARGVVVLLGGMSVAAGGVAADTWLRVRRAERQDADALDAWRRAVAKGNDEDAAERAALATAHPASPIAALLAADAAAGDADPATRRELHDRTVRRTALAARGELRKGLGLLATVGSTAPFVGLFGTVIGIVNAFHELGVSGQGGVAAVSTGIAEALITTAFGILVAVPAVWLYNHLSQRIGRLVGALECAGEELALARLGAATRVASTLSRPRAHPWR